MTPQLVVDNSTVFSIVPLDIKEFKPGINPGYYIIDRCLDENKPSRLFLSKPAIHNMEVGGKKEPIQIPTPTAIIAKAIVDDYIGSQLWCTSDAKPGLTWIQGNISEIEFKTKYKEEYDKIKVNQKKWFFNYVRQTDIYWIQSKKSPKVVSDTAKYAAKFLGLDKEWCHDDIIATEFSTCPACFAKVDPRLAICNVCFRAIINRETYDQLQKSGVLVV